MSSAHIVHCPRCAGPVSLTTQQLGRQVLCPHCNGTLHADPNALPVVHQPPGALPQRSYPVAPGDENALSQGFRSAFGVTSGVLLAMLLVGGGACVGCAGFFYVIVQGWVKAEQDREVARKQAEEKEAVVVKRQTEEAQRQAEEGKKQAEEEARRQAEEEARRHREERRRAITAIKYEVLEDVTLGDQAKPRVYYYILVSGNITEPGLHGLLEELRLTIRQRLPPPVYIAIYAYTSKERYKAGTTASLALLKDGVYDFPVVEIDKQQLGQLKARSD